VLCVMFVLLGVQHLVAPVQPADCALPTDQWETMAPEDAGMDSETLADGETKIGSIMPYLRSVVVVRHGCIVYERYFEDAGVDVRQNGFSVTKSVTGTLIGIAIAEDEIGSAADSIAAYLPLSDGDHRRGITLSHLLHMLSGLGWEETSGAHIGGMLALARDEVAFILDLPLDRRPGTHWNYSTADSHLLSAVLARATGGSTLDYARSHLFGPLGIENIEWTADADGVNLGGTQLFWTPRDMAKFGLLSLRGGDWDGEQVVSSNWIDFLTEPQLDTPSIFELSYAAHWWHVVIDDVEPMFTALGYGGQYVLVSRDLDLVVVTTADSSTSAGAYISAATARRHEEAILNYIEDYILAAVE
jgi:CubicO group peptidase (beta-lactamase class C family)